MQIYVQDPVFTRSYVSFVNPSIPDSRQRWKLQKIQDLFL